jgi:hypothetical protein
MILQHLWCQAFDRNCVVYFRMLIKRAQGRKKFGRKNFKKRFFKLTTQDLSYSEKKGKYYLEILFDCLR